MQDKYMLASELMMTLAENNTVVEDKDEVYAVKADKLILDCLAQHNIQLTADELYDVRCDFDYYNAQFC